MPEWEYISTSTVMSDRRVRIPESLMDFFWDDSLPGANLWWNYYKPGSYIILSTRPIPSEKIIPITESKIYTTNKDSPTGYVRIPTSTSEDFLDKFTEGKSVVFLASKKMLESDNKMVYFLTNSEILKLLPDPESQSEVPTPDLLRS